MSKFSCLLAALIRFPFKRQWVSVPLWEAVSFGSPLSGREFCQRDTFIFGINMNQTHLAHEDEKWKKKSLRFGSCIYVVNNQSMFYFMSVHIEVILERKRRRKTTTQKTKYYTSLPKWLWTINLKIELIISVLYKTSPTLLQALKSYPFFRNNSVVIRHSSSMCLTDRIFLQTRVTFCEYLVFHVFRRNLQITLAKYREQESIANLLFVSFFVHILMYVKDQGKN